MSEFQDPSKEQLKLELTDGPQKKSRKHSIDLVKSNMEFIKVKVRATGKENKRYQRSMPAGVQDQCLFGLPTVKPSHSFIVITEGEYDAMAVHQATNMPCVSLPNGASHLPK